jgi:6-phosphofructokinase 2
MRPILTVTLNPTLDLAATVDRVVAGPKLRLGQPVTHPGGGGINVARVVARLGGDVRALAALGGATGAQAAALLAAEGIAVQALPCPGDTRLALTVAETATQAEETEFRFVLPGPDWGAQDAQAALDAIAQAKPRAAIVVLSGSQPPGLAPDFAARLNAALPPDAALVLDTSGAALAAALRPAPGARPLHLLRLDHLEAEEAAGQPLPGPADTADFAARLIARGVARSVVLARGAEGSVLVDGDGTRLLCRPPSVRVASKVGAGDSFAAACVLALARGGRPEDALRAGTAAAAAAVTTPGTELCRAADVARLEPLCTIAPC